MKRNRVLRWGVVALAMAVSSLAGAAGKTLVYCSEGSPAGFDPARYTAGTDFDAAAETVFNRLVEFERGQTTVRPGLAEKWSISPDGLVYTFNLRSGVNFHRNASFTPTREFNADDVVFTFTRMIDRNHPFNKAAPVEFPYASDMSFNSNILAVEAVDSHTVRFRLKNADAAFIQDLAMSFTSVHSAEYADTLLKSGNPTRLNSEPIGTGPFVFKSYQKDAVIRYEGNTTYWRKGEVLLDKLIFAITPDASVRVQKLQKGECQISAFPRPADLSVIRANTQLAMPSQAGFNLGYLAYNVKHQPLDKREVRQALDMAIDKKAIIQAIYQGAGEIATNPMPPTQWSYNKKIKDAQGGVELARTLLKKAGVADGTEITLWAMPVQRPYNPNAKLMAEMIQSDWGKIGIKAKIVSYEWGEYLKRAQNAEHDAILVGWTGDNGDPDNWLGVNLGCAAVGGNNYSQWCYKPFDDLIVKARRLTTQNERSAAYEKAQEIFKQELPWTTIAHSTVNQPMSKKVKGFKVSPFGLMSFYGVSVE